MSGRAQLRILSRRALLVLAVVVVAAGLTILSPAQKASADICTVNGRDCWFGYFFGGYDGGSAVRRNNVLRAPALLNINNIDNLVVTLSGALGNCPGGGLWNQNDQNATGAAFIILTMLGAPPGTPKNVACQRFAEWRDRVYTYEALGLVSINIVHNFGGINTRSSVTDVAYYPSNGAAPSIVFYHPVTRAPIYAIKRDCGNPIGVLQGLPPPQPYNLQPTINVNPSGVVELGDTITFDYRIINTSPTASPPVNCSQYGNVHGGYYQHPNPNAPEPGGTPGFTFCPQAVPGGGNIQVRPPEAVVASTPNTTICRMLYVWPATPSGEVRGYEACVAVASKPYLKVYGGDVSVGGGVPGTCTMLTAGAVSWNQKTAGHPGAGTQFGAMVTGLIREFATAQGNAGGAPAGAGLSFANTTNNPGIGQYGGNFGTASCIKDFYSQYAGGAPGTPAGVSSMNPGVPIYATGGNHTLSGGNVNPNQRTTVYINGDLFINGNINYVGSWNTGSMPMFKVVVRGNIFIGSGVTNLDGVYIAQPRAGIPTSGTIYTCATGAAAPVVASGAFYNTCTNKLTVNGAFIARNVEFLRTRGSQRSSTANEPSSSANIAEVFNYGPAFWIPQPASTGTGTVQNYDSITSLPPVL